MKLTMNIKELHKNLKNIPEILEREEDILIFKNSKPSFKISRIRRKQVKTYNIDNLRKLQFSSGDKHLANNIDKYIYI